MTGVRKENDFNSALRRLEITTTDLSNASFADALTELAKQTRREHVELVPIALDVTAGDSGWVLLLVLEDPDPR